MQGDWFHGTMKIDLLKICVRMCVCIYIYMTNMLKQQLIMVVT